MRTGLNRRELALVATTAAASAAAGGIRFGPGPGTAGFVTAALALAGLAWIVAFSTEQLGERFGPAVTGFLQSTLGNLPEFFVVVFALSAGEVVVAQTSLIGSLFANALLVLGLVLLAGAREARDGVMRFRTRLPMDTATLLLLALFIIVVVGLAARSAAPAGHHVKTISIVGAVCLLAVYAVWLVGYLRRDQAVEPPHGRPRVPLAWTLGLLAIAGVGAAFVSEWLVDSLDPAIHSLGISRAFAGLVIVAIAGNAVENVTGILLAAKGRADLAISVVKNSVAQIAAFLFPLLVLVSFAFDHVLTFSLAPVYIGALFLTALALWQITGDGEAVAFEGLALVALYAVLATFAYVD